MDGEREQGGVWCRVFRHPPHLPFSSFRAFFFSSSPPTLFFFSISIPLYLLCKKKKKKKRELAAHSRRWILLPKKHDCPSSRLTLLAFSFLPRASLSPGPEYRVRERTHQAHNAARHARALKLDKEKSHNAPCRAVAAANRPTTPNGALRRRPPPQTAATRRAVAASTTTIARRDGRAVAVV
jgi:hypothetical protein